MESDAYTRELRLWTSDLLFTTKVEVSSVSLLFPRVAAPKGELRRERERERVHPLHSFLVNCTPFKQRKCLGGKTIFSTIFSRGRRRNLVVLDSLMTFIMSYAGHKRLPFSKQILKRECRSRSGFDHKIVFNSEMKSSTGTLILNKYRVKGK